MVLQGLVEHYVLLQEVQAVVATGPEVMALAAAVAEGPMHLEAQAEHTAAAVAVMQLGTLAAQAEHTAAAEAEEPPRALAGRMEGMVEQTQLRQKMVPFFRKIQSNCSRLLFRQILCLERLVNPASTPVAVDTEETVDSALETPVPVAVATAETVVTAVATAAAEEAATDVRAEVEHVTLERPPYRAAEAAGDFLRMAVTEAVVWVILPVAVAEEVQAAYLDKAALALVSSSIRK